MFGNWEVAGVASYLCCVIGYLSEGRWYIGLYPYQGILEVPVLSREQLVPWPPSWTWSPSWVRADVVFCVTTGSNVSMRSGVAVSFLADLASIAMNATSHRSWIAASHHLFVSSGTRECAWWVPSSVAAFSHRTLGRFHVGTCGRETSMHNQISGTPPGSLHIGVHTTSCRTACSPSSVAGSHSHSYRVRLLGTSAYSG